jgi:hypothetical protein
MDVSQSMVNIDSKKATEAGIKADFVEGTAIASSPKG